MRTSRQPAAAELIRLEAAGPDRFHGHSPLRNHNDSTFGGLLLGQSLAAAAATVADGRPATSLNGYFLRPGLGSEPLDIAVERTSEGRRFSSRRVTVSQRGKAVFVLTCSFSTVAGEAGHQAPGLQVEGGPEDLPGMAEMIARGEVALPGWITPGMFDAFPIDMRPVKAATFFRDDERSYWVRIPSAAGLAAPGDHQALMALVSDYWLAGVSVVPHTRSGATYGVLSLNHSLWFHRPARADEWLLYRTDSHWSGGGRGLARGLILNRAGELVATVMQEALLERMS